MAGDPKTDSSNTDGKATTKVCCCTSSGSVRRRIRCRPIVIARIVRPTSGRESTTVNCFTRGRYFTTQLSHMWIDFSGHSSTNSCVRAAATTLRIAGKRRLCSKNTRSGIHEFRRLRRTLLGIHRVRRARLGQSSVNGVETGVLRLLPLEAPRFGPDDGTVAPWVVIASLPFAPEIVIPNVRHLREWN
jgi:hypothetical protein